MKSLQKELHYTATQSTLELFKLEVNYSSTSVSAKVQDCIGVTYTATQSTLELATQLELFKLKFNYSSTLCQQNGKLHRSHLYSNSINTGTIQARSQLFINFVSAKVQDCIGVTYTATQSTLELFKLKINYSSTLFQAKCKIA